MSYLYINKKKSRRRRFMKIKNQSKYRSHILTPGAHVQNKIRGTKGYIKHNATKGEITLDSFSAKLKMKRKGRNLNTN